MSFWDVVWFIVISFAFVAYLMVMFNIISDLFRDRETSGPAKAAWIVALIFLPFLTAVVYLITRGRGMAERSARSVELAKRQQDAYIREAAGQTTPADQIAQAQAMFNAGIISQGEYDALKAKALV
jgi:SNF family Na+-dependent transporter